MSDYKVNQWFCLQTIIEETPLFSAWCNIVPLCFCSPTHNSKILLWSTITWSHQTARCKPAFAVADRTVRGALWVNLHNSSLWVHYIGTHCMTISHLMVPLGKGIIFQEMDSFMILLKFYFQKYFTPLRRHFYHQHIFNGWWRIFFIKYSCNMNLAYWMVNCLDQRKLLDSILTGSLLMTRILDHGLVKRATKASVGIILMA